jgi:hypothetical protein
VAHIPDFEATALFLIASGEMGVVDITTQSDQSYRITPKRVGDDLWTAILPDGAANLAAIEITAASEPWDISGLALVNEATGTFQPLVLGNYRLIHSGDVKIYENLDVLPRAFMVYEWLYRPSVSGGILAMEASEDGAEFDPAIQAVIVADGPERILGDGEGAVEILSYEPERFELSVNTSDSGLLVLTEANYPGWLAEVDGERVEIQQTDGLFRGVVVPEGAHEVVFVFRPMSYEIGRIVTLISLFCFLIVLFYAIKSQTSQNGSSA